jgi:hypothetical protein
LKLNVWLSRTVATARARQIREEQRRHCAVHERVRAAKGLKIRANAKIIDRIYTPEAPLARARKGQEETNE